MERRIKFSIVPKILGLRDSRPKLSSFFETFMASHAGEDEIIYTETQSLDIFAEPNGSPFIHLAYDNIKGLNEIPAEKKYIFALTDNLELPGWEKKVLFGLKRESLLPPLQPQTDPLTQDDPEGWMEILKKYSPESLTHYLINECSKGIKQGHFICKKDENGFKSLVVWNINKGIYRGRFWWNRDSGLEFIKDFWSLHRLIESKGIKDFYAYCQPSNKAAWQAHELLGYRPIGPKYYLYFKR